MVCVQAMKRGVWEAVTELLSAKLDLARHNVRSDESTAFVKELRERDARPTDAAAKIEDDMIALQRQVFDQAGEIESAVDHRIPATDPVGHFGFPHCSKDLFCAH